MATTATETRIHEIIARADAGERLSEDDALALIASRDLETIGAAADRARNRRSPADEVTFIIDRNVNYTNVCVTDCDFCAFYRHPRDEQAYVLPKHVIFRKIEETLALGGTALLLQGGHHPNLRIEWYEDLFSSIKERYPIHSARSPSEVLHRQVLEADARRDHRPASRRGSRLHPAAAPKSSPGARDHRPRKTTPRQWLSVMRAAHLKGLSTSATMMYGTVDTWADWVEHLRRLRELQDEALGFRHSCAGATSPVAEARGTTTTCRPITGLPPPALASPPLPRQLRPLPVLVGDPGTRVSIRALEYGCDDMGSIMIEENVVRSAGTAFRVDTERMVEAHPEHRAPAGAARHRLPRREAYSEVAAPV